MTGKPAAALPPLVKESPPATFCGCPHVYHSIFGLSDRRSLPEREVPSFILPSIYPTKKPLEHALDRPKIAADTRLVVLGERDVGRK